ncbi:MAG: DUF386 domain-containing protein [Lachnospiraceae bacterium]|nr:DUF386 domain-containing protein [Lachnospiraceae bacterium]
MNSKISEAIEYLLKQDLANMPAGKYPVNDDFYYMVQEYTSRAEADCHLESHQKYVDIQWLISGVEAIDCTSVDGLEVEKEYNPEKDVTFWKEPAEMMRCVLSGGSYVILLPENAHKPCIAVGEPAPVKKVVAKVKIA